MHLWASNLLQRMEAIMKKYAHGYFKRALKISVAAGLLMSLSGCIVALPPAIQLASLALDGVSYATTGKSVTDHAISGITAQDCAMARVLKGDDICSNIPIEVAMLPDGTPVPGAVDAGRSVTSAQNDAQFQAFSDTVTGTPEDSDEVLDLSEFNTLDMVTASESML